MPSLIQPDRNHRRRRAFLQAVNHDFSPGLNRYVYRLKQPLGWFVSAALVATLLGLFGETEALAVAGALVGLISLGMVWPAVAIRCVAARLHWRRRRCEEGESLETVLDVSNRWPWRVWGLVIEADDAIVNGGHDKTQSVSLASVSAMSKSRYVWEAVPKVRGEYPQRTAALASGFPFGLWTARRPLVIEQSILVWPKTIDLGDLPLMAGSEQAAAGAWIDRPGMDGDVIGVRPYRDGDSLRHVHWAQSARQDALVVCERQSVARQSLRLEILPTVVESIGPSVDDLREWLIRIGGSVARTFLSHHWSVEVIAAKSHLRAEPGTPGLHRMLDGLARMDWKSAVEADASQSFSKRKHHQPLHRQAFSVAVADAATFQRSRQDAKFKSFRWIVVDRLGGLPVNPDTGRRRYQSSNPSTPDRVNTEPETPADVSESAFASQRRNRLASQAHVNATLLAASSLWMAIDVDQPVWEQLRRQWSGVCRKSLSSSVSFQACLCDAS